MSLRAGCSYTLRYAFDMYGTRKQVTESISKDYRIAAELVGQVVTETNPDLDGLTLMPYRQGQARSNDVQLPFAKKGSDKK